VYEENTEPVIEHYRETGELIEIDGEGAPDDVFERITGAIES
jgi:adenylate kinase